MSPLLSLAYLVASVLFILCLRGLSSPESARRGILMGEIGMFIAVVESRLAVGSSARINSGLLAKALAMATR